MTDPKTNTKKTIVSGRRRAVSDEMPKTDVCNVCKHPFHGFRTGEGVNTMGTVCSLAYDENNPCPCQGSH